MLVLQVWCQQELLRVSLCQLLLPHPSSARCLACACLAGEDRKRLVGMLIPERALPELLAELQARPDTAAPTQPPEPQEHGWQQSALKGSLYDIMSGVR